MRKTHTKWRSSSNTQTHNTFLAEIHILKICWCKSGSIIIIIGTNWDTHYSLLIAQDKWYQTLPCTTHTHTQVNLLPSIGGLCFIFSFSDARAVFNIFRLFSRQPNLTLYNHRFELAHSEWMKMKHTIDFRRIWFGDVYKLKMRRHSLSHDMVRVWNEFWRDAVNDDEYFMFNSSFVCVCSRRTN